MTSPLDLHTLPAGIAYLPASGWGLTDSVALARGLAVQPVPVPELYVHHSAGGFPDQTSATWDDDPVTWAKWIDAYAREVKGYKAPDYSFAIHSGKRDGIVVVTIIELRGAYYPAATLDRNTVSKAIVYVGDYRADSPLTHRTPSALELLAGQWLTTELRRISWLRPDVVVRPHRDNPSHPGATSCCGDELIPWVPWIATPWTPAPVLPVPGLRYRMKGDDVALLRDHLVFWKMAKHPGRVFTLHTRRAVKRMQAELDVDRSGKWDQATADAYRARLGA